MVTKRLLLTATSAAVLALLAGCSVHNTEVPGLTGPSGLGTNITISLNPDVVTWDGASTSLVTITATGPNGQPLSNLPLRVATEFQGAITTAMGALSAFNVVTNGNGQATVIYTAPRPTGVNVDTGTVVQIAVTPDGSDFTADLARTASIKLQPAGTIGLPPSTGIVANFTYNPSAPNTGQPVVFNGSTSTTTNATLVSFQWTFSDTGATASGVTVQHTFATGGDFDVTLTVADSVGRTSTSSQPVHVNGVTLNPPVITVSPSPGSAIVNQSLFFTSTTTVASNGRPISSYTWNFGDGSATSVGQSVSHAYASAGTYTAILTIADDQGNTGSATVTITVTTGNPIAQITVSPPSAAVNSTVSLIGSQSTAAPGRTIVSYAWNFGDGNTGSGATTSHPYRSAGTFTITLVVTDDQGNQGIATATVTITP